MNDSIANEEHKRQDRFSLWVTLALVALLILLVAFQCSQDRRASVDGEAAPVSSGSDSAPNPALQKGTTPGGAAQPQPPAEGGARAGDGAASPNSTRTAQPTAADALQADPGKTTKPSEPMGIGTASSLAAPLAAAPSAPAPQSATSDAVSPAAPGKTGTGQAHGLASQAGEPVAARMPAAVAAKPPAEGSSASAIGSATEESPAGSGPTTGMAASGGATGAAAPASDAPGAAEPAAQGNSASRTTARAGAPADPMREAMSLLFAARAAAATGRLQQAADAYQASATAHAGNFMALEELGNLYLYGLREPAKAAEAYNQAAERLARVGHWGRALQLRRWVSSLAARAGEPDQP